MNPRTVKERLVEPNLVSFGLQNNCVDLGGRSRFIRIGEKRVKGK